MWEKCPAVEKYVFFSCGGDQASVLEMSKSVKDLIRTLTDSSIKLERD